MANINLFHLINLDPVTSHLVWMWSWYLIGALMYIAKRSYYMMRGPARVANGFNEFVQAAGVPLAFRLLVDSLIYWLCFNPTLARAGLDFFGWQDAAGVVGVITQYAPVACIFGLGVDPMVDWAIGTVISKVPFLKDFWPQMPGPLVPVQANGNGVSNGGGNGGGGH